MMNTLTITSFREVVPFSKHIVAVLPGERSLEIREIRNMCRQPESLATCLVDLHPRNYAHLELCIRRTPHSSRIVIEVEESSGTITVEHDGRVTQQLRHEGDDPILLDGPSPMFDWANAIMVLGICDGETFPAPVYTVDVGSGCLVRSMHTYHRTDSMVTVRKGVDAFADSEIQLRSDYAIDVYYSGGFRYEFGREGRSVDEA